MAPNELAQVETWIFFFYFSAITRNSLLEHVLFWPVFRLICVYQQRKNWTRVVGEDGELMTKSVTLNCTCSVKQLFSTPTMEIVSMSVF